ncbi:MAG TPA: adenosylcobinamide-GDP ribazoletransferase [Lachnospiraceae bacterium]|nr:adenosylcobinamide-GDP ribazoletransferase [Lachnospiraceae bacterium]
MKLLQACIIAFSTYSKIPMPKVDWNKENKKYAICFFPMVGVLIGAVCIVWYIICSRYQITGVVRANMPALFILLLTGGIHTDGYMDTMDALHSYAETEKKLQILKDPHIGAFAVISVIGYYLAYTSFVSMIGRWDLSLLYALGFVLSRILSGLGVVYLKNAKQEGMLYEFSDAAHKRTVRIVLFFLLGICAALMLSVSFAAAVCVLAANGFLYCFYRYKAYREFGGITGDLAGWFLVLSELISAGIPALFSIRF